MIRRVAFAQLATAAFVFAACRDSSAPAGSGLLAARGGVASEVGVGASDMKLHPAGFGEASHAAWKAQEGLPDNRGQANHALYLQKMTATTTFAAGVAVVRGLEGSPASDLTALSWEHRDDGHCGAGAPRWNLALTDAVGVIHVLFLGCNEATHATSSAAGWTIDSWDVQARIAAAGLTTATITGLAIVFDEGTDAGVGFVFLDNIKVSSTTWTSPSDNGN